MGEVKGEGNVGGRELKIRRSGGSKLQEKSVRVSFGRNVVLPIEAFVPSLAHDLFSIVVGVLRELYS